MTKFGPDATEAHLHALRAAEEPSTPDDAREQAFLQAVKAAGPEVASPGELGWARLRRSIEAERKTAKAAPAWRVKRFSGWQMAASIAAALALGQIAAPVRFADKAPTDEFVAASGEADAEVLLVGFRPDATEEAMRTLLDEAGGEFVSGPSALGLYGVSPRPGTDISELITRLKQADDVVESAQNQ